VEARGMAEGEKEAVKADGRRCPKCGALIDHLDYWERAINTGEYRVDGFHNIITSNVDEFYFLCPECGKILFVDIEAAKKFLRGQPIKEEEIYPEDY
jgi:ribosomal protein S27AE